MTTWIVVIYMTSWVTITGGFDSEAECKRMSENYKKAVCMQIKVPKWIVLWRGTLMVRGWRNDPHWVAFYAQRDKDRIEREIARVKADMQSEFNRVELEASIRRLRRPLTKFIAWAPRPWRGFRDDRGI
jgi:hypothetical protein